ncbi:MAG: divalent-cation tolerance protein CutA [Candidatus Rokuibacteriota bacterium]
MPAREVVVVLVTAPSAIVAERIAAAVVPERLAASVNIIPGVRSVFHWEDRVRTESEVLLLMKTTSAQVPALEARVRALHPYTVPAFLALPVVAGYDGYVTWLSDYVTAKGGGEPDEE